MLSLPYDKSLSIILLCIRLDFIVSNLTIYINPFPVSQTASADKGIFRLNIYVAY